MIRRIQNGVFKIETLRNNITVGSGTGFLVPGGFVTNSHVLPDDDAYEDVQLCFDNPNAKIIELKRTYLNGIKVVNSRPRDTTSPGKNRDFVYVEYEDPDFANRWRFEFSESRKLVQGDSVMYLGYPFDHRNLAVHQGHIASIYHDDIIDAEVLQVDGSVCPENSGGPLINLETGMVEAIITEAETGILLEKFEELQRQLKENIVLFSRTDVGRGYVGGVDVQDSFRKAMKALLELSQSIRRSANVGIGIAYSIEHLRQAYQNLSK